MHTYRKTPSTFIQLSQNSFPCYEPSIEKLLSTCLTQHISKPVQLTSIFPLCGNTSNCSKNVWCKYINTAIYSITYLQKIQAQMKKREDSRNIKTISCLGNAKEKKKQLNLRFCTYKSFKFLCVMQQFVGNWISHQFPKLAG